MPKKKKECSFTKLYKIFIFAIMSFMAVMAILFGEKVENENS